MVTNSPTSNNTKSIEVETVTRHIIFYQITQEELNSLTKYSKNSKWYQFGSFFLGISITAFVSYFTSKPESLWWIIMTSFALGVVLVVWGCIDEKKARKLSDDIMGKVPSIQDIKKNEESYLDKLIGRWNVQVGKYEGIWEFASDGNVTSNKGTPQGKWHFRKDDVYILWNEKHWETFNFPIKDEVVGDSWQGTGKVKAEKE